MPGSNELSAKRLQMKKEHQGLKPRTRCGLDGVQGGFADGRAVRNTLLAGALSLAVIVLLPGACSNSADKGPGTKTREKKVVVKAEPLHPPITPDITPSVRLDLATEQDVSTSFGSEVQITSEEIRTTASLLPANTAWQKLTPHPDDSKTLPDFASVYKAVRPSVVKITTFGPSLGFPYEEVQYGMGSGFFFGKTGEILTNHHVIKDGSRLQVETSDGRIVDARLVGSDPLTDLALINVEMDAVPPGLPAAPQQYVQPGMWVMAIGNPLGLEFSASKGIISAVNRRDILWDGVGYWDFIQTDAAINPGNSGGPLVDEYGRTVGICTAIEAEADRIGFAVPLTTAQVVIGHLRKFGKLRRAQLGIQFKLEDQQVQVIGVYPNTPAHQAGLLPGDQVLSVDGVLPDDTQQLRWQIAIHPLDQPLYLEVQRGSETKTFTIPLAEDSHRLQKSVGTGK
jgi:serine protease Do